MLTRGLISCFFVKPGVLNRGVRSRGRHRFMYVFIIPFLFSVGIYLGPILHSFTKFKWPEFLSTPRSVGW